MNYDRLDLLIPDGYEVVETDDLVKNSLVDFFSLRWMANRRARRLNDDNETQLYRFEVEAVDDKFRSRVANLPRLSGWAVVTKQNVLRRIES